VTRVMKRMNLKTQEISVGNIEKERQFERPSSK
jgi:hypothetical protein